ncbi:MAG: transcriptional repressor [Candidatus Eisenbacteria bacterium]|nr:transcriptional repressor [Candidatus Latescibacterota bacterium]MBD3302746.1 transcriptional repressor [Candidatus Eisenbacteria bacterium]
MRRGEGKTTAQTIGSYEAAARLLRRFLRERGLRSTPERLELLRLALASPAHFDADELLLRARRSGRKTSRATAYRTLALFEECGILRKARLGKERDLYEILLDRGHHDHIVCTSCGRIEEFFDPRFERIQERIAHELGFALHDHVHEIYGTCADCAKVSAHRAERAS